MKSERKYHGPCPEHPKKRYDCKHCNAYYMQQRYEMERAAIRTRRAQSSNPAIYSGLHWPAPEQC